MMVSPYTISQAELDRMKRDTLSWLQEMRPGIEEIPQGERLKPHYCPLANALGQGWWVGGSLYGDHKTHAKLPRQASRFRAYFDLGHFPELDVEAPEWARELADPKPDEEEAPVPA
jgi:hypothetical protein